MPARHGERIENTSRTSNLLIDLEILRKEEIAQLRKVRIQQVRLQSKDIANKVLQDIRNEKDRQFQLNKAKEDDVFKKWQDKKISTINLLYKENMIRHGEAYRNAENEPDPEKEIEERSQKITVIAKDRGRKAMDQLRREQENVKAYKETCAAKREKVRRIENLRSALISTLPSPGSIGNITQPTDLEETSYGRSTASSNENEESIEILVEEVTQSRSHPKIPSLSLGSGGRTTEKISAQTSHKSTQNHKHPVAFTVDLYDRGNPCTFTRRLPNTVRVERISSDACRNAAEAAAEEEKREMERKEKKEMEQKLTEKRGKKALAKELIRRDFDQLMNRLEGLARKERLVRGLVEPPLPVDMYMSESRCAARSEKRQRNLDSVFEGMLHSNDIKETQIVMDTQPPPIVKAHVPEWGLPILSETPPEILNVGLESKDTTHLSIENMINEGSPSVKNISLKEAARDLSPSTLPYEEIPAESRRAETQREDPENDVDAPRKLSSKGKTISGPEEVKDSIPEDTKEPICSGSKSQRKAVKVPEIVKIDDNDGHCSPDEKQKSIPRAEACVQTEDLTKNVDSSSVMENDPILVREGLEPSDSSSQDSSVKVEEVRVVLKFNESSSPSTEESGLSTSASAGKIDKKKRVIVWKKHCKLASNEEIKTVIDLESPDTSAKEGGKEQESKLLPVGDSRKEKRRRKRSKGDVSKAEKSMLVSPKKAADPIYPSLDSIASERRAKALLKEVRAQRREIEKLRAGLSEPKTEPPALNCYVRRLLSMTRESVEALSVSDVSTPSIHFDSPKIIQSPVQEATVEKLEVEKIDKATSPIPCSVISVDETVSLDTTSKKITSSSKSSSTDTFPASSTSISSYDSAHDAVQTAESAHPHQLSSTIGLKPTSPLHLSPLTPPPSPEYEQLADLHSRRIHDLGNQLTIVRELQKRILSIDSSSESEKSSTPSVSSTSKSSEKSSSSAHSVERKEPFSLKPVSEVGRNWDVPDLNLSAKERFEDISLPDDILLDLEKPSKPSQEVISLRRKSVTKSGPPTTPLKGLKWSDLGYQIPHELSTITEIDSKLISPSSILESRKLKDLHTSTRGANEKLTTDLHPSIRGADEKLSTELVTKMASADHPEEKPVEPFKKTSDSCTILNESVDLSKSPLLQESSLHDKSLEHIPEGDVRTSEPASGEISLGSESISPKSSDDSQLPQTLDDVLRMLGISPTIFKRPQSPQENVMQESSTKKHPSPPNQSDGKTNMLEENIMTQKDDMEQVSELGKEVSHPSESFGRSPFGTSSHHLLHSTPLHSSSSGTTSSLSDSKQKNTSGFPFLGESAPSSICSNGTPQGGYWRNIDDDDSAAPKEG